MSRIPCLLDHSPGGTGLEVPSPVHPRARRRTTLLTLAAALLALPLAVSGAPVAAPAAEVYVVQPGETLSLVAVRTGTSVSALQAANDISDPDHVHAGTVLVIPDSTEASRSGGGSSQLPERLQESPDRLALMSTFDRWAARNGIPADLLKAMTWLESGWQMDKTSPDGAVGIGQLMPDTVDHMEQLIGEDLNQWEADDNVRMAARYLRWLLARYGTASDALAAYYQGPGSLERNGAFDETRRYVANVLSLVERF